MKDLFGRHFHFTFSLFTFHFSLSLHFTIDLEESYLVPRYRRLGVQEVDSAEGLGTARARLEWGGGGQFSKRNSFKMNGSKNPKSEKKSSNQKKRKSL